MPLLLAKSELKDYQRSTIEMLKYTKEESEEKRDNLKTKQKKYLQCFLYDILEVLHDE